MTATPPADPHPLHRDEKDATRLCTAGVGQDPSHGAVMPPLYLSANYTFADLGEKRSYDYSRSGNPTRDVLAEALSGLEGGAGAVVTATGMAAVDLALSVLKPGETVVVSKDCYGGTHRLLEARKARGAFEVVYADLSNEAEAASALAAGPKLVYIETPTNPLMRIVDLDAVCTRAKSAGALVAVDNTFLSPVRQKPIAFGADLVVHSTTKYINGHSDVVGGAVVAATPALYEQLAWWANCTGVTGSPFDSYQTLRGLRTLQVRLAQQEASAGRIADFLSAAPEVAAVHYPGLTSHPGHAIAARQQSGFGAMLSFELAGGLPAVRAFVRTLPIFSLAESLGGIESLVCHPVTMSHAAMTPDARRAAGIGDGLLRLSIGLEDTDDLVAALAEAFSALPALSETGRAAA